MEEMSTPQARRLALGAQGFADQRPTGRIDRRHMRKLMRRLKLLQLDSVPVLIRAHYMPAFSRLGPYRTALFDEIAYQHDEWFEAWAHEASVVPVESEPLLRWQKQRARRGDTWQGLVRFAKEQPEYVRSVLDEIAERGPILTSELRDPRPRTGDWWASRSWGQLAADWLFRIGAVGVRRSSGFEKNLDLLERIVPAHVLERPTPSDSDAMKSLLVHSAQAHGVGTADCLVDYFRLPKREAKALLPELVEDGRLIETQVECWSKPAYRHPGVSMPRRVQAQALLSPFDPICWNRNRTLSLFDFHYRIEIYVPKEKRVHGYYVLPFLLGDRLVGRFDLKTDRQRRTLEVRASHIEPWADPDEVAPAAAEELRHLAQLVGADDVEVSRCGELAPALASSLASR